MFRAKIKELGGWVTGYLIQGEFTYICTPKQFYSAVVRPMDIDGECDASLSMYIVEEDSVEMCTGLQDKFGNDIFENDIVRDVYGRIMKVMFNKKWAKFQFELIRVEGKHADEPWIHNFKVADIDDWFDDDNVYVEVVGEVNDDEQ